MAKNQAKRQRHLRRERERQARSRASQERLPLGRFQCGSCGVVFEQPGMLVGNVRMTDRIGDPGVPVEGTLEMSASCPVCGQHARALNQVTLSGGDQTVTGFASTPDDWAQLAKALDELRAMDDSASLSEILEVLDQQGDAARPVADYLRRNHLALIALGAELVGLVIALLVWLSPAADEEDRVPPPGITREQMDDLIVELREEAPRHDPDGGADRGERERAQHNGKDDRGAAGADDPAGSNSAAPDAR